MPAPSRPESRPPSPPNLKRGRLRLFLLAALVGFWLCPWMNIQVDVAGGRNIDYVLFSGPERSGAAAAAALLALWGLAATSLGARTLAGLRIGSALTDAAVAASATALLFLEHPWIPGGDIREAWGAIFGPLTLLALLDAGVLRFGRSDGYEISVIRAAAAFFAAGCLAVALAWIPAGIALWLALSPLMFLKTDRARTARRMLEVVILLTAIVHGFSPRIQEAFVGVGTQVGRPFLWFWVWGLVTAIVFVTALDGILRPEADGSAAA